MDDKFTSDTNIKLLWELITSFNIDKESNQVHFYSTLDIVKSLQQPVVIVNCSHEDPFKEYFKSPEPIIVRK